MRPILSVSCALICVLLPCAWVLAHETHLLVTAEGARLVGRAHFGAGVPVRGGSVRVSTPDGALLAELRTDDEGKFAFDAAWRCGHVFELNTVDGHHAEYTVPAEQLPAQLPARPGIATSPQLAPHSGSAIEGELERALARQLTPLRQQIDAWRTQTEFRDVIGGVGYVFGILGIVAYLRARRLAAAGSPPRV